jgi:hypothetical protein
MQAPSLRAAPVASRTETSPLGAARIRRGMSVEEAAVRTGLGVDEIKCLEESRIYRFPSVDDALAATLVYATALGISELEARKLAGLPAGPPPKWTLRRSLALLAFLATCLAVVLAFGGNLLRPEQQETAAPRPAAEALPPPWKIRVDVYNGTEIPNAATQLANEIGGPLAYRLGTVENAERSDYLETRVYYPAGSEAIAERLADALDVGTATLPGGDDPNRLVVIVGRDLAAASP